MPEPVDALSRLMEIQQIFMQSVNSREGFVSPWDEDDHPENFQPSLDEYVSASIQPPLEEEEVNQRENIPPEQGSDIDLDLDIDLEDSDDEEFDNDLVLDIDLEYPDDEELDEEIERVRALSFLEASEYSCNVNLSEETICKHLKTIECPLQVNQEEGQDAEICAVCQLDFECQEILATLECEHKYHADCIKRWLLRKNICPICRRTAIHQEE